ncbi:LamG-like jellyroll fold domain-containing protein [Planctomycetota bacterium]
MKTKNVTIKRSRWTLLRHVAAVFLCLAMPSSTVFGFATWSGVDASGYSHLVNNPDDFPSWDLTVITYTFDASFDVTFPNPDIKDQVRLAFQQWDDAHGTAYGTNYSYYRFNGSRPFADIRSITVHELGHVLGIRHPDQGTFVNRNWGPGDMGLVALADNGDEVMHSTIAAGAYNQILSHDELDAFAFFYGQDILFQEVTGPADITISTQTAAAGNLAVGGGSFVWRFPADHSLGARMISGFVRFNDSSSTPIGFQTLGINWDYQNVGGKPTRNLRVRTTGTNNTAAPFHYDNPGPHQFTFTPSVPSTTDKDDLVFEWGNPSSGDIPASEILHVGLELDVWDWTVVSARVGHPDGTDTAATLLSFHDWDHTIVTGTPILPTPTSDPVRLLARAHHDTDKAAGGEFSYQDSLDIGPPRRVLARGIRLVAPDVESRVFNLALANVTGRELTLDDLNRNTLEQLQSEEALEYVDEFQERIMQPGEDFIIVLDGNEPSLPGEILERGNFLILDRPDLLEGEVFVFAQSTDVLGTGSVGTYALLGGRLNGPPERVGLRLGFNEEITNNTGQDAYDFHLEGTLKSETLPKQVMNIFGWPGGSIPYHDWTYDGGTITHVGGDYYHYSGTWSGSVPVPPGQQVHIGKSFEVNCANVLVDLRGWWTDRNGEKINPDAGTEVSPGIWVSDVPLLGFDIQDNIPARLTDPNLPQTVTLQNATDMEIEIASSQLAVTDRHVPLEELVPDSNLLNDLEWRDIPSLPPFSIIFPGENWTFDLREMDMVIPPDWTTVVRGEIWDPVSGEYRFFARKCQAHPPVELVPSGRAAGAFAFGSRMLTCPTFNNPAIDYTMVYHGAPDELAYDPSRGWGYEMINAEDLRYGDRGGYGVFGPFDDSPNNRNKFPDECPEELYDSFIGAKSFETDCSASLLGDPTPCDPPEGIIFRVDVPNGRYRFVGAFGDADNVHAHRIVAEDGGSGPPEQLGPNHVVLVHNFDQAQQTIGEADPVELGEGVYARVGFDGKIPPPGDGVFPSPQFVNMDEHGLATDRFPSSPVLNVTQGYIRIHQLQGNSNDGPGGPRDANGGDMVILELWKIEPVDPGTDGLLARWACDEGEGDVVGDVSGNGRDGLFVNGDPAWVEGVSGSAVELIGPTLIETPPLDMELTEATMAGWILPYGPQPDWSSIVMQRDPGLATGFNILGYQLAYHWNDTSDSWSFRGGDMIAEDEWTFAAVTIEPDKASFYVNGLPGSVNEISHGPCMWDSNVYLGGDGTEGWVSRRMIGALDDVLIYDRALSEGEILYLAGFRPPAENLLANGGFEDDLTGAPWSTYGDASLEVVHELVGAAVPEPPIEGEHCLHVTVGSAGANFWDAGLQHGGHVFEAGKSYTLSAYLKAKEGTMNINFKPELAADPWTGYGSQEFTMTDTWAEYTVNTGVIDANVDPASITFHIAYAPGEFWVDDVRFTEDQGPVVLEN